MRALLVEDDRGLADALVQGLRGHGWSVRHTTTGREAVAILTEPGVDVDLVLLDMGLPDHDGLWVCQQVRERSAVPIVAVTARRSESAVVGALRAGVDDYVTKPYSLAVLLARMDAVLRRSHGRSTEPPAADPGFVHDRTAREVHLPDGAVVPLTAKESELLAALARTPGEPVSRAALMEEVWDTTWVGASRTLDVHVAALRAKLAEGARIETVRGVGYRLVRPAPGDAPGDAPGTGP
ncbi:response regulator transcription factor [Nocardioides zeae]|uniref:DNA-binding response OmpR family regulator n=1 Tax=Nocardioides zeae TaxID=1457234 RepID=A0AAJ1WZ98_9ACTN|nr:response regulator transcription factor [Nocardioides zeae]MDQ1103418.1 DNA-binding response OmpR family regulator [Nocardioides zeae]